MSSTNSKSDEENAEKMISCTWKSVLAKCRFEHGHALTSQFLKQSNSAEEFAARSLLLTAKSNDAETTDGSTNDSRHPPARVRAFHTLDRLFRLRRTVMIVGGGWKPIESMHISFIQAQGFNVINLVDQLHTNSANWSNVGLIFLVVDSEWAMHGSFTTFEKLMGRLCLKAPQAKIYVSKIPIVGNEQMGQEKMRHLKNFNFSLGRMCRYSCIPTIHMWHLDSFIEEVRAQSQVDKPHYLTPECAHAVMQKLVKRVESMATRLRRLPSVESTAATSAAERPQQHVIRLEDLEKKLVGKALAKQNADRR